MAKVWLITGSSRGLGLELAKAVLATGDRLVASARNPKDLQGLVAEYGERVRAVELDVTHPGSARDAVAVATSAFGRLDVVVNNAGYANTASAEDMPEQDFRAQIETNFFGVVNVTRAALPVLRAQRSGHIIQISSIGGRTATPGLSAYQSAKWAVGGFSEVVASEVRGLGIHVTVAEPGGMKTDWAGSSMRIYDVAPDYQVSVGSVIHHLRGEATAARGDTGKISRLLVRIANDPNPPLRLLIGSDAVFMADLVAHARSREDARWQALSTSTDADGMTDFAQTPVAQYLTNQQA
jgi:NAD(P)-dependent dehydrogenase (short-subunit alcohol dehydrogenase family)